MPTHQLAAAELKAVTPEQMVSFNSNEILELFRDKHGLDLISALAAAGKAVRDDKKIKPVDRLKALRELFEATLKIKRAGGSEKGGGMSVNIAVVSPVK